MIFSVTPNPTLDLGGVVDRLVPNEKNYVHDETRFPGGNAINAARMIHRLGGEVTVGGFLGSGVGSEIQSLIEKEGLPHAFTPVSEPARINITVSLKEGSQQTRLSFAGPLISNSESRSLSATLDGLSPQSLVLFGGSLPPGFSTRNISEMMGSLRKKQSRCIVDIPGPILKSLLSTPSIPFLIKPNLSEFCELVDKEVKSCAEVMDAANELSAKIPYICISSVEGGALLLHAGKAWFGKAPSVKVRSTVGAGDSMVGAMAYLIQREKGLPAPSDLLRWGLAAACATLTVHGTQLGHADAVRSFLPQIEIQER
ncbi:MAG: 1-phosphofructokinase family hexose kinase [Cryobacterium sp.]|nr:1-phosphofructokinase family hexose kinase [Oligoflexia bacterium]